MHDQVFYFSKQFEDLPHKNEGINQLRARHEIQERANPIAEGGIRTLR